MYSKSAFERRALIPIGLLGLAAFGLACSSWVPSSAPTPQVTPPSEMLAQLAKDALAKDRLASYMEFQSAVITNTTAVIDYATSGLVSGDDMVVAPFMQNLENTVPTVFQHFPPIEALELYQYTTLRDTSGQVAEGVVIRLAITRPTYARIQWNGFKPRELIRVLTGRGDSIQVHPAISDAFAAYLQNN